MEIKMNNAKIHASATENEKIILEVIWN